MREYWLFPWRTLPVLMRLVLKNYEALLLKKGMVGFVVLLVALVVFWHVYVPFHELFHVFGCWLTGGEVTELALKRQYGGGLLQPLFPFITPDSDYAGQLTGFTTPNDWSYLVVDLFPYLLSLPGIALFVAAGKKYSPVLFALAVVLGLTPIFSIPGDFYEAASLGVSRLAAFFDPNLGPRSLVSDDIFALIPELKAAGQLSFVAVLFVLFGVLGAIYLCLLCFASQLHLARYFFSQDAIFVTLENQHRSESAPKTMAASLES